MSKLDITRALAELEDQNGRITPEAVVAAARDPKSPLHKHFEWDDAAAAVEHRLNQARTLIRSVKVEFRIDRRVVQSVAYIRDPAAESKEQGYRSIESVRRNDDDARAVLINEFGSAAAHLRRARQISVALSLEGEVDGLLERVGVLRQQLEASASTQ
jgi:hypothetical protein